MKDICTYKYRLYPDAEQRVSLMSKECGCEQVNAAKNIHRQGVSITVVDMCKKPSKKRKTVDCSGGCEATNETMGEHAQNK